MIRYQLQDRCGEPVRGGEGEVKGEEQGALVRGHRVFVRTPERDQEGGPLVYLEVLAEWLDATPSVHPDDPPVPRSDP